MEDLQRPFPEHRRAAPVRIYLLAALGPLPAANNQRVVGVERRDGVRGFLERANHGGVQRFETGDGPVLRRVGVKGWDDKGENREKRDGDAMTLFVYNHCIQYMTGFEPAKILHS